MSHDLNNVVSCETEPGQDIGLLRVPSELEGS